MLNQFEEKAQVIKNHKNQTKRINYREKGITLVALVVTIIVLLILAGITISFVLGNNGILNRAQYASNVWANATNDEAQMLNVASDQLTALMSSGGSQQVDPAVTIEWVYNHSNQTIVGTKSDNTTITLNVGDLVNYNAGTSGEYTSLQTTNGYSNQVFKVANYNGGWRAFGAKDGKLIVIAEEEVPIGATGDTTNFYLRGQTGYVNGVDELNNICAIYGHGTGAESAKCATLEDINTITGYNPNCVGVDNPTSSQIANGTKYGSSSPFLEYGHTVYYIQQGSYILYTDIHPDYAGAGDWYYTDYSNFTYYDDENEEWVTLSDPNAPYNASLVSNDYYYFPTTLTADNTDANNGIASSSSILTTIFDSTYWLANRINYHFMNPGDSFYDRRCFGIGGLREELDQIGVGITTELFESQGLDIPWYNGVRPIVTISQNYNVQKLN